MDYKILETVVNEHLEIFKTISEEDWNYKISEEKWSKKEILGHLVDSAMTNSRRFIITQYSENQNIVYDQNFWVRAQNWQNVSTQDIVNLWKALNQQVVNIIRNMPDQCYENTLDIGKDQKKTVQLKFVVDDYIPHLLHHLDAIKKSK